MKSLLTIILCLGAAIGLKAQTLKITDAEQRPLRDVRAVYKVEGKLMLSISNSAGMVNVQGIVVGSKLILSSLGYETDTLVWTSALERTILKAASYGIDEVVITGQYAPTTAANSVHKVRTIGAEEIEARGAITLNEVLQNELNFRVSQDNILGSGLEMQGVSGENVKIMIDGVPVVGRLNGNIDLSQINLNNIERVEIVEGPLAVNYGSNALAGTINLITKTPKSSEKSASASVFAESAGHFNTTGAVSFGKNRNTFSLSAGRNYFDGWSPSDRSFFHQRELIADQRRVQQWNPREQLFADAKYRLAMNKGYIEFSGAGFNEEIINRGAPRGAYAEWALDDIYITERYNATAKVQLALGSNWSTHHVIGYNTFRRKKNTYVTDLTGVESTLSTNASLQDTSIFNSYLMRGSVISSGERKLNVQLGYEVETEVAEGRRIIDESNFIGNYALFITGEWKPTQNITIKPGLRAAYNTRYSAPIIPSINALFNLGNNEVRISYAQGFRAPGLKELSFYFVDINHNIIGNENLEAERSHNLQASYLKRSSQKGDISWELNGFYNRIFNLITLAQVNGLEFTYTNIGERHTGGGRAEASVETGKFNFGAGVAYVGISNNLSGTERWTFTPEGTLRAGVNLGEKWFRANIFYKYNGRQVFLQQEAEGETVETYLEAFQNMDLTVSKDFWKGRMTLDLGARNLFDVQNINATFSGGAHGGGGSRAIGTGRTYFTRISINLRK